MVVFEEGKIEDRSRFKLKKNQTAPIEGLEEELKQTRAQLEKVIEDLEASNEELKASNE